MSRLLLVFIALAFCETLHAQQLKLTYTRYVGGNDDDGAMDAIFNPIDKSIVFVGITGDSCGTGDIPPCPPVYGQGDLVFGKIDSNRNVVWMKQFGGTHYEVGKSVKMTRDSGYIVLANASSVNGDVVGLHGSSDAWLLKFDKAGSLQWKNCYGSGFQEVAFNCIQTGDGGYLLITTSNGSGGDVPFQYINSQFTTDWLLLKTDSLGNKQWSKTLGGTGGEGAASVLQVGNRYYVAGSSTSDDHYCTDDSWHPGVNTGEDFFLICLDSNGDYLWNRSFGGSLPDQFDEALFDERDSSIVMVGHTYSRNFMVPTSPGPRQDVLVVKANLSGSLVWCKVYGDSSTNEWRTYIRRSPIANGYLVTTRVDNVPALLPYYGGGSDVRLFMLDSTGNIIAEKVLGGSLFEHESIPVALDKGFVVLGSTNSPQFGEGITSPAHSANYETPVSYLEFWGLGMETEVSDGRTPRVFPNPASNRVTVQFDGSPATGVLRFLTTTGQIVHQRGISAETRVLVDTESWARGWYLVHWTERSGAVGTEQLILK